MDMQKCTKCGEEKQATEYTHRKRECRECRNTKGRIFYNMNKDRILEDKKQYREENREKILRKVTCDCGAIVANNNLAIHKRSKRHQQYLELQERKNNNKLWQITYYDEADEHKQIVLWITEDKYTEFHKQRNFYDGSNYKLVKEMGLI